VTVRIGVLRSHVARPARLPQSPGGWPRSGLPWLGQVPRRR